jgi:cob(I)alamin adenosyltransferase
VKIYTRHGDDGTTSLRVGGRVRKDSLAIDVVGTVDEAQAALGLARSECERDSPLDNLLTAIERDLWILMAEVTTGPADRPRLEQGATAVTPEMVDMLETNIDEIDESLELAAAFAVPGENRISALLDFARAVVRRGERLAVGLDLEGSYVVSYLNRLSDLCWMLARSQEHEHPTNHRPPRGPRRVPAGDRTATTSPAAPRDARQA